MKINPTLMTTANAKLQAASSIKKNWQKYKVRVFLSNIQCPIFLYKPIPRDLNSAIDHFSGKGNIQPITAKQEEKKWDTSLLNLNTTLYVGELELATDTAQRYWIRRNVCLLLAKDE